MTGMAHRLSLGSSRPNHPVRRADARLKLLSALALLLMVLSSRGSAFPLGVALFSLGLCVNLGVRPKILLFRFSEPLFIALVLFLLKLFGTGSEPLFSVNLVGLHLVGYREGLMEGVRLASRIAGSVSVLAVVGFSTPFTELMASLSWLKVPQVFVDISLFAWRYLFLLLEEAQVVYHAQRNRLGYAGYGRGIRSFGTLAGVLVIKAFDHSQQVTTAMVQRGYDGDLPLLRHKPFVRNEVLLFFLFLIGMAGARSL